MLVKRAQQEDESEMRWRGKDMAELEEAGEGEEDPRSDSELLDILLQASSKCDLPIAGLDTWGKLAQREELPEPREDEDIVLADDYDAKKADEEEKKNQADTANFSGGEWAKWAKYL